MEGFGKICFAFFAGFLMVIAKGYVWYCLWAWFVCTTVNVPQITLAQASGFALIIIFANPKKATESETTLKQLSDTLTQTIAGCIITLAVGKLITIFL